MDFQDVVRTRRMVRRYADRPVDPAVVERMLANAVRAPSAGFTQGWAFLVLQGPDEVSRFWSATSDPEASNPWLDGMRTAPVVVVPLASKAAYLERYAEPDKHRDLERNRWPVPYWYVDAGMASLLILQTAVDEGLGACFFGVPGDRLDPFRTEFGVPAEFTPVGAITVGHRADDPGAAGSPSRRARRPLEDVVHRGGW
jgi:nitroreductase